MSVQEPPTEIEVRVRHRGNEATFLRRQAVDRLGRPAETAAETLRKATKDAQTWIRGQQ